MAELIGVLASILTLLAAAGQSCKFLYDKYVGFSDAPKDVQKQATRLCCLHSTIRQLIEAYKKLPKDFVIDIQLQNSITELDCEITSMRLGIEDRLRAMSQGRREQLQESCKWMLYDSQMNEFHHSVDYWSSVMTNAVMAALMVLSTRIDEKVDTLLARTQQTTCHPNISVEASPNALLPHNITAPVASRLPISHDKWPHERKLGPTSRFAQYLTSCVQPVGLTPLYWTAITLGDHAVGFTAGSIISRHWSPEGKESHRVLRPSEGYAMQFVAQSSGLLSHKLTFIMHATYAASHTLKFNPNFSVQWVRTFAFGGPHHMAIRKGDMDYIKRMFSSRKLAIADVTSHGDTLLHLAAGHNQGDMIDMLVSAGADVNAINNSGETPLHTSLRIGKEYECARRLLINGANLHQQDKDGRTPLHSFFNDAISQAIRHNQHDIDLTLQDRRGMTVAHWASWTSQSLPKHVTHQPLKSGQVYSPFAVADVHGRYMLHFAAERGNVQLVRYFLSQPQALMMLAPDYEGRNILHYATASRRFHLVHALVQGSQLDIEERDHRGRTVLHHAALRMNLSAVEQILALRSNLLDVQDDDGQTPLELARLHGSTSVIGFLEARYPCSTPSLAQSNGLSGKANPGVRLPGRENFGVLKQYFCCFIVILLPVFISLVLATELALQHGRRL